MFDPLSLKLNLSLIISYNLWFIPLELPFHKIVQFTMAIYIKSEYNNMQEIINHIDTFSIILHNFILVLLWKNTNTLQ